MPRGEEERQFLEGERRVGVSPDASAIPESEIAELEVPLEIRHVLL